MSEAERVPDFAGICTALGIGNLQSGATPVEGGLLHRLWRVDTDSGTFAIKVLNPEIMSRPTAAENFRKSEIIARAAKKNGVPAVVTRDVGHDPWIQTNGSYLMVFDWQAGRTLRAEECSSEDVQSIGRVLCQIHNLDIQVEGLKPHVWPGISDDIWREHIENACHSVSTWGFPPESLLNDVLTWSRLYKQAVGELSGRMVISHGDLDPKNVIWGDGQVPYVIDWESAGYVNPSVELLEAAINWSRNHNESVDKSRFQAMLKGYIGVGGTIDGNVLNGLYASIGGMLGWIEYNMRRSVDQAVFECRERKLGQMEVQHAVLHVRELLESAPTYAEWIEDVIGSV